MKKYQLFAIVLIGFILLDVGLLIVLSWFAVHDKSDKSYSIKDPRYFLIYISIVVAMAGLLFVLYEFSKWFLV